MAYPDPDQVTLRGFPRAPLAGGVGCEPDAEPDLSGLPLVPHVEQLREQLKEKQRQALLDSEAKRLARKEGTHV
jgi:hypothetical protein